MFPILTIKEAAALPTDREVTIRTRNHLPVEWKSDTRTLGEWSQVARDRANAADHEINEESAEACLRYILADAAEYSLSATPTHSA